MPRSRTKRASGASPRGSKRGGAPSSRWQTLGMFVTFLALAALVGSLAFGIWQHFSHKSSQPGTESAAPSSPGSAPADARPVAAVAPSGRVRVQVLNATPTHGLARVATGVLRDHGFDVVETGNAARGTPPTSVVYDRVGNLPSARQTAGALGIARVETRRDTTLLVDVTVVLGGDWHAPGH